MHHPQPGVSHLLEYMAFKATKNRTHFRLVREVESIGANVVASATREQVCACTSSGIHLHALHPQMAYVIDATNVHLAEALEILADAVLNPEFHPWEVQTATARLDADLKKLKDNPQTTLMEVLHLAYFWWFWLLEPWNVQLCNVHHRAQHNANHKVHCSTGAAQLCLLRGTRPPTGVPRRPRGAAHCR